MFTTFKQCPEFAVISTRSGHMVVCYNLRVVVRMQELPLPSTCIIILVSSVLRCLASVVTLFLSQCTLVFGL